MKLTLWISGLLVVATLTLATALKELPLLGEADGRNAVAASQIKQPPQAANWTRVQKELK